MGKLMDEHVDRLLTGGTLDKAMFAELLRFRNIETTEYLYDRSRELRKQLFGNQVTILGRIVISNYCKNECKMCGIRRENRFVKRFRLSTEQILKYCGVFYRQGVYEILLESGEDVSLTEDAVTEVLSLIKKQYPRLKITLSLGNKNIHAYRHWNEAGAKGYLFSHGTANDVLFKKIFPANMTSLLKKQTLWELKEAGFKVGSGLLLGIPYQTIDNVLDDLYFLKEFAPSYLSVGTFIPVLRTPFEKQRSGNGDMALYLIAILRLMLPHSRIISVPSLDCALKDGRLKAFDAGADTFLLDVPDVELVSQYGFYERKNGRLPLSEDRLDSFKAQLGLRGLSVL